MKGNDREEMGDPHTPQQIFSWGLPPAAAASATMSLWTLYWNDDGKNPAICHAQALYYYQNQKEESSELLLFFGAQLKGGP